MYDYNINVLKQQYNLNDQIDLTKPKSIDQKKSEENKKIDNNCIDCKDMTIDQINEIINK